MKKSLTKEEILRKRKDIEFLFKEGKRVSVDGAGMVFVKNNCGFNRVLFLAPKKIKKAVDRNRLKRVERDIYRNNKAILKSGYDLALVFFPGDYFYEERKEQFCSLIKRAGLSKDS
ncbi:ribonuclease P protein component [Spirochaetia bacterium 38H-sp]|uniref:Ribonuclease P protein component n=1 Tax=Rarispira pelagica TaxID=3141764 RepID=A0ABU9U977_9SPIR